MGAQRIVIVGGGVAGLAAAFELTKPGLIPGSDVTVYQMGWRLGGKCASGHDDEGRIVEHGLHIWFGYYENAFRLLQEVYEERGPSGRPFAKWDQAIKPQSFTPIGDPRNRSFIPLHWPLRDGTPGDGKIASVWQCLADTLALLAQFHDAHAGQASVRVAPEVASAYARLGAFGVAQDEVPSGAALQMAHRWSSEIAADWTQVTEADLVGMKALLRQTAAAVRGDPASRGKELVTQLVDVAAAFICGVVDDVLLEGIEIPALDRFDFREWLILHGAKRDSAFQSPVVKALYDTMFQYCDGDDDCPSYSAGTAAQVILRLFGTYKRCAAWEPQGSLGDIFIVPLYEVLKARGIEFKFFHKLEEIALTSDGTAVAGLQFCRQADTIGAYEPTVSRGELTCWPAQPRWDRLVNGADLCRRGVDFESRWCEEKAGDEELHQGVDFDDVILAIPLGAFKRIGHGGGPCDALIRANPRFRAMTEKIGLVPSLSVQVWCSKDLSQLGWVEAKPAMVSGPPALQIWADMSQVLPFEEWPEQPRSLHYFCNVLAWPVHRSPSAVPGATCRVRDLAIEWFENRARKLWTESGNPFDWTVLVDSANQTGSARIDAQVLQANIDPSSCCVSSAAGSTRWRLKTDQSGFDHLFLAGSWIDTGFNTECIEAAVMSGKQASRAMCGYPEQIDGEDFLHMGAASGLDGFGSLLRWALSLLGAVGAA